VRVLNKSEAKAVTRKIFRQAGGSGSTLRRISFQGGRNNYKKVAEEIMSRMRRFGNATFICVNPIFGDGFNEAGSIETAWREFYDWRRSHQIDGRLDSPYLRPHACMRFAYPPWAKCDVLVI
jgi:hypothetical protein